MQIHKQPTDIGAFTAELASLFRSAIEAAGMQLVIEGERVRASSSTWIARCGKRS